MNKMSKEERQYEVAMMQYRRDMLRTQEQHEQRSSSIVVLAIVTIAIVLTIIASITILAIIVLHKEEKVYEVKQRNPVKVERTISINDITVIEEVEEQKEFIYNDTVIDNWVLDKTYQEMIYNALERYDNPVPFEWLLSVAYMEKSYNNPYALNINSNGSYDCGIMQINSSNKDIIKRVTLVDDIDVLYKPWANIRCAAYYSRVLMDNYDITNEYEFFICYNGGYGALNKIRNGKKHISKEYAEKAIEILRIIK